MSLTQRERAVLRDVPAPARKDDSLVEKIVARLRGLGVSGRGPESNGRGLTAGELIKLYDDFETDLSKWTHYTDAGGSMSQTSTSFNGTYGIDVWVTSTGESSDAVSDKTFSMDHDWHIWSYIRRDGTSIAGMGFGYADQQERTTGLGIDPGNNELLAINNRAGEQKSTNVSLSTETWYLGHTHIQSSTDTIYAELFDTDENQLGDITLETSENLSTRNDQAIHIISYTWQGNQHYSLFDDVRYKQG